MGSKKELLKTAENFASLTSIGVFWTNSKGEILKLNNPLLELLGFPDFKSACEFFKRSIFNLFYEKESAIKVITDNTNNQNPSIKRFDLLNSKNTLVQVSINFESIPVSNKWLVAGYVDKIAEDVKSRNELEGVNNQRHDQVSSIRDFYYLININGTITKANQVFLDLMKVKNVEQLNSLISENHHNEIDSFYNSDLDFIKRIKNDELLVSRTFSDTEINERYLVKRIPLYSSDEKFSSLLVFGFDFNDFKNTEKIITENLTNLKSVIENTQNSIFLVRRDKKIVFCNTHFKKFAYNFFEQEIGENQISLKFLPKDIREDWDNLFDSAFDGINVLKEFTLVKDGRDYYFEGLFNPVTDETSNIVAVTVFLTDITERKAAENALKESENRFRQLAENTNDAFILSDDKEVIYVNPAFEKIIGNTFELMSDKSDPIELIVHEDDHQRYVKNKNLIKTKGITSKGQQYRIVDSVGLVRLVWIRGFPVFNKKGLIYRYLTVISDLTELSELKNAFSNSQIQQEAILDNIPYLAWLKDKEGRYISVNEPFASFFHMKADEIIGHTDRELFAEEIAERNEMYDVHARNAGKRQFKEEIWETEKGLRWIETISTPIFKDSGDLIGITGISRDISDRKQREDNIIENEEHFRSMLQYSSDAISIIDSEGFIVFESSLRNRISDFMIDELIGKSFSEKIHPDDVGIFNDVLQQILSEPNTQLKREYRSLHKNKKWIYVESIFSNHINNPSIKGIVVNTRDISDRKMSELKERVYHENLIFLSNSAIDLLGISDREDIYKYIAEKLHNFLEDAIVAAASFSEQNNNFRIMQISGLEKNSKEIEELIGESLIGMEYNKDNNLISFEIAGSVTIFSNPVEDLKLESFQVELVKKVLETLNVNKIYNISMARNNKLLGNITILTRNRTIIKFKQIIEAFVHQVSVALHRCQLEFELVQAKTKAEESDMLKTAFLANMSHEIRTPMNGILGFAEMLNDDNITEANRKKYVEIINSNGKMLMNLIDDIIDFAKIEAGQIKILKQEFSLNTLLTQIHSSFLAESLKKEKTNVKLRIRKAFSNEDCFIQTDPNRLRQILTNLVGNSFKFTQEGYIEFGYNLPENGFIEFYVRDTGIGIPPDKIDQVFERFVQADYSRSRKYSGSGLGLAISRAFVELLGGKMWATSEVKKGSTFSFNIPFIPAVKKTQEEIEKKKSNTDYNWSGKCFLVAEDDKFSYKLLEGFLKKTKADILHAEDGQQAVDICKSNDAIDLILMDVQMPEMNGMEATRYIKKFRKKLPIIAQTANAIAEERQRCFEAGFDDFVTKPINISELFAKIEKCLASK